MIRRYITIMILVASDVLLRLVSIGLLPSTRHLHRSHHRPVTAVSSRANGNISIAQARLCC